MATMKAVWLENKKIIFRNDVPIPTPPQGELLVKVLRSGICNTDIELEKGYYPYCGVLGHEFVGKVVDSNAPEYLKNKIVAGEINCVCHRCSFCSKDMKRHCANRTVLGIINRWGCHAEYVSLPAENLFLVPSNVSLNDLCFIEPLAAALEIQEQIKVNPDSHVAVIGDGKLGLLVAKTLAAVNQNISVYGHHMEKLILLKDDGVSIKEAIDEKDCGTFDIVVECTGNKNAFQQAVNLLRPRGTLVMKSTHEGSTEVNMAPIVVNELTLVGSRCGPFEKAIWYLQNEKINLNGLLQKEFAIEDALEAFNFAKQRGSLKVQLVMANE